MCASILLEAEDSEMKHIVYGGREEENKKNIPWNAMVDQWFRLNTSISGSMGSIPGRVTKTHDQRQTNK